jgi:hypothetical protein
MYKGQMLAVLLLGLSFTKEEQGFFAKNKVCSVFWFLTLQEN